ncbi:unnamed protein product [Ilex paraguariensis]
MASQRLKPDVATYGSFIYGLCKEGKISVAVQVRDQMLENGITPSVDIYNTILEAMFKRGKFWDIISVLKDMARDGCEPDSVSLDILHRAATKGWMKGFPKAAKCLGFVISGSCQKEARHKEIPC